MNRILATTALLFAVTITIAAKADKPVHLFVLSGQSNMAGMNPENGFIQEARKLFSDGEVVYIKVARGGQPIRFWVSQWNEIAEKHGIDAKQKRARDKQELIYYAPILEQVAKLREKHSEFATVTFCWMQGERDAREGLSAAYAESLKQLITNLRTDLKEPDMNFVIGRLSDWGPEDNAHWQAIRRMQVELAEKDPRGSWADCDDLNNKEDKQGNKRNDLHYTKEGYAELGRRYARQAKALASGTEPSKDGRPQ